MQTMTLQAYFKMVYDWVTNPQAWAGVGPVWLNIGIILAVLTVLQMLPNDFAGGTLFNQKAAWITYLLDALWIVLVFVAPFIPTGATIALVVAAILIGCAVLAKKHWN